MHVYMPWSQWTEKCNQNNTNKSKYRNENVLRLNSQSGLQNFSWQCNIMSFQQYGLRSHDATGSCSPSSIYSRQINIQSRHRPLIMLCIGYVRVTAGTRTHKLRHKIHKIHKITKLVRTCTCCHADIYYTQHDQWPVAWLNVDLSW